MRLRKGNRHQRRDGRVCVILTGKSILGTHFACPESYSFDRKETFFLPAECYQVDKNGRHVPDRDTAWDIVGEAR